MGAKFKGIVTGGKRLGRKLGFPTANIIVGVGAAPREGVYAVVARKEGRDYEGMGNVGRQGELFGGGPATDNFALEVNLFDFEGDLYGCTMEVELVERIRDERKFATEEELREALADDRRKVEEYFKKHR